MLTPTIHLNGDTAETLIKQQQAVVRAAEALKQALYDASPNGRNFYVQGPDAMPKVRDEHRAHVAAVERIKIEYEQVWLELHDEIERRANRRPSREAWLKAEGGT